MMHHRWLLHIHSLSTGKLCRMFRCHRMALSQWRLTVLRLEKAVTTGDTCRQKHFPMGFLLPIGMIFAAVPAMAASCSQVTVQLSRTKRSLPVAIAMPLSSNTRTSFIAMTRLWWSLWKRGFMLMDVWSCNTTGSQERHTEQLQKLALRQGVGKVA